MKNTVLLMLAVAFFGACSGSSQGTTTKHERYLLSEEEIAQTTASNAYELIRSKRPEFLRPQGPKAFQQMGASSRLPVVYVNGLRYGYPDDLTKIPAESVKEVRYLNSTDASLQFGTGHVAGALLITTKK